MSAPRNRDSFDSHQITLKTLRSPATENLAVKQMLSAEERTHFYRLSADNSSIMMGQQNMLRTLSSYDQDEQDRKHNARATTIIEFVSVVLSWILIIAFFPIVVWFCYRVVREYQRAVIFRMGRIRAGAAKGPGSFFVLPCMDECHVLDLRTVTFDVPPQEILTLDAVTVAVDAVVYYRVYKDDCNSALGLLGVVGLASYLQSVLAQMNTAGMDNGRRKRDIQNYSLKSAMSPEGPLIPKLMPMLTAVAHARDKLIPAECSYRQICIGNQVLVEYLGQTGHFVGTLFSKEMAKMLTQRSMKIHRLYNKGKRIRDEILDAARLGRRGKNCYEKYQECSRLHQLPSYNFPKKLMK